MKTLTTPPATDTSGPRNPRPDWTSEIWACLDVLSARRARQLSRLSAMQKLRGASY